MGDPMAQNEAIDSPEPIDSPTAHPIESISDQKWLQVTSRMESASSDISERARALSATAHEINGSGRLSRLTQLSGRATDLNHKVIQARMAADQLEDP